MAGNSVGTAYLTLVPKLDSNMAELESGLEDAGKKGGSKFADGLKGIAKTAAFAAAGKAVADTFMESFNSAGTFEQLAGGVEAIFKGADTNAILADARGAWETMNLSANEYLSVINDVGASFAMTMGAEKGYETAKKGMTAIAGYASGTGKSVELLSEKFSMITRSTGSYQSIADQFSGLLPATSEGFLEAAQSSGILSDSYKKLTEVPIDEYQAAVAAMLEKGAQDMGLLGQTALETKESLSGSIDGMKAAWENLLIGIGSGSDTVGEDLGTFVEQFGVMSGQIVDTVMTILGTSGSLIAENLPQIISDVLGYITSNLPGMLSTALQFFLQIVSAIGQSIPSIIGAIPGLIGSILSTITDPGNLAEMADAGLDLIHGLGQGISNAVDWVIGVVQGLCESALGAIKSFFGINSPSRVMMQMGEYMGEGMAIGIEDSEKDVKEAIDGLNKAAIGGLYSPRFGASAIGGGYITIHNLNVSASDYKTADQFVTMIRRAAMQYA